MTYPGLIGLYSPAPGAGKTTIANILVNGHHYHRIPFAEPLKLMTRSLLQSFGRSYDESQKLINDPVLKEEPIPELGVTPRRLMQTLGTEWGRQTIHKDIWLKAWKASVVQLEGFAKVVVDDVRFPNELDLVKAIPGSELWWIDRPGIEAPEDVMAHASQQPLDKSKFDRVIINNGSFSDLRAQIANIWRGEV